MIILRRGPLLVTLMLAVALAAAAVGCGGGDGNGSSQATTVEAGSLTKPQFIAKAEEVCAHERKKMGVELIALGTKTERETVEEGQESVLIPGLEAHVEQIRELGAPKGEEAEVEKLLSAMQRAIEEASKHKAKSFEELTEPLRRHFDPLASAYGMSGCQFR